MKSFKIAAALSLMVAGLGITTSASAQNYNRDHRGYDHRDDRRDYRGDHRGFRGDRRSRVSGAAEDGDACHVRFLYSLWVTQLPYVR